MSSRQCLLLFNYATQYAEIQYVFDTRRIISLGRRLLEGGVSAGRRVGFGGGGLTRYVTINTYKGKENCVVI